METITMTAAGRELAISGTVPEYLSWFKGLDAGGSAISHATRDLPRGSLCIDVGANIGITALSLAVERPDCHVIAIEPVPANATCLRHNIRANALTNVEVIEAAVTDRRGTVTMTDNGPWSAVWGDGSVKVPAIPLDDLAERRPAFVKIDVEGYEPYVIAGARELLGRQKPLVHLEFNTWFLLVHHHDPISFAKAIWAAFDIVGVYYQDKLVATPAYDILIVRDNIVAHGSVTDLSLRPRAEMPSLEAMICAPAGCRP
ncbi:MAG: FkbM family methyltransferase [Steroidobacteraceae bacterium]|jgi:FkbM family methyltransferase